MINKNAHNNTNKKNILQKMKNPQIESKKIKLKRYRSRNLSHLDKSQMSFLFYFLNNTNNNINEF